MLLEQNEAGWDRVLRVAAGAILFAAYALWFQWTLPGYVMVIIALIALVTGLLGHCAIYSLLGIRTGGK